MTDQTSEVHEVSERMSPARAAIVERLDRFDSDLPGFIRSSRHNAQLRAVLNNFADQLLADVTEDADQDWALDQLNVVLRRHNVPAMSYEPPGPL